MYLDQNGAISMKKNAQTDEKTRNRFIVFIINGINDEYIGNRSLFLGMEKSLCRNYQKCMANFLSICQLLIMNANLAAFAVNPC